MLSLILASGLQLPMADERTARSLLRKSPRVTKKEKATTARVELWLSEDGKAISCDLLDHRGSREIAVRLCKRATGIPFAPARTASGSPVHSLLVTTMSVYPEGFRFVADSQKRALENELQTVKISINLSKIPSEIESHPIAKLNILVDETGKQGRCETEGNSREDLEHVACEQSNLFQFDKRFSKDGEPVSYVRQVTVEFLPSGS